MVSDGALRALQTLIALGSCFGGHSKEMAFVARSRSVALGATEKPVVGFQRFDLKRMASYPFGTERNEHSGQFQRPIQKTHMFFNTLLQRMNVGFEDLDETTL